MGNVIQWNSKGRFTKVNLKDGNSYGEVRISPCEYDPYSRYHIIERRNGSKEQIATKEIDSILFIHD